MKLMADPESIMAAITETSFECMINTLNRNIGRELYEEVLNK